MTRSLRRFIASIVMLGLLFAQFGVAALACPLVAPGPGPDVMPAMHEGCSGTHLAQAPAAPPAGAALCELHCQTAVSVPSTPASPVALVATAPLVVVVRDPAAPDAGIADMRIQRITMATAPPPSILYCRFQI
jgi:hypothetical protein